jgi:hypothetical protein
MLDYLKEFSLSTLTSINKTGELRDIDKAEIIDVMRTFAAKFRGGEDAEY